MRSHTMCTSLFHLLFNVYINKITLLILNEEFGSYVIDTAIIVTG